MALVGKAAATATMQRLERKDQASQEIPLNELQPLVIFNFPLTPDQRNQVNEWAERRLTAKPRRLLQAMASRSEV